MNNPRNWRNELDEHQRNEVAFAEVYADRFSHGTDGHNRLLLIAKMAELLDAGYATLVAEKAPLVDPTKPVDISRKPAGMT